MNKVVSSNLVCKNVKLSDSVSAFLILPRDSDDPIVREYLSGATPNAYMLDVLDKTTCQGDLVVDIGCHVGTFSIGAAGMGRRVIAIDANPLHSDLVEMSARVNNFRELCVVNRAISLSPGSIRFRPNGLFGAIDYSGASIDAIDVASATLDEIVSLHSDGRKVRFVKMDIEGAEYEALLSAFRTLSEDEPILWWESNGPTLKLAGRSVFDVRLVLEKKGYKTFRLENNQWTYAPPEQIQPEAWVDMLAISERDQMRWADRIRWDWPEDEIVERCKSWAVSPHRHVLENLIEEINKNASIAKLEKVAALARVSLSSLSQ